MNSWSYAAFCEMIADYAENACTYSILSYQGHLGDVPRELIEAYIAANFIKFTSLAVALLAFFYYLFLWLRRVRKWKNVIKKR